MALYAIGLYSSFCLTIDAVEPHPLNMKALAVSANSHRKALRRERIAAAMPRNFLTGLTANPPTANMKSTHNTASWRYDHNTEISSVNAKGLQRQRAYRPGRPVRAKIRESLSERRGQAFPALRSWYGSPEWQPPSPRESWDRSAWCQPGVPRGPTGSPRSRHLGRQ